MIALGRRGPTAARQCHRATTPALIAALIVMAALVLAACGGTATSSAGGAGQTPAANAQPPQHLTIGFAGMIETLDGDQALDQTSLAAMHLIDGNLYELGADGAVSPLLVISGSPSADGLTWTFKLKPRLKFSDGAPLTSSDVAATFARAKADKSNAYAGFVAPIRAVEAPTPTTAVFRLTRPYPSLPTILSQPEMTIYPAAGLAKGKSFFNAPVSAGPYRIQSWGGGPTAVLERNPYYAGPPPRVETIDFKTIADFNARLEQVQSGQLDFAYDIPPSLLAHVSSALVARLTKLYGFISIPLNNTKPPLNQVGVRKAVSMGIDRAEINRTVWNGQSVPLAGFWPSTMNGYDRSIPTARDAHGALAQLKGTSCEHGCIVKMLISAADTWAEPMATIVAQNLRSLGITVKLVKVDDATINQDLGNGDFQMAATFLYDYNNVPDGLLTYALTANGGLNANFTGYRPPADVQRLVNTAITQPGPARAAALAHVDELFVRDQPFVTVLTHVVGTVSRYPPKVVSLDAGGFVDVERRG